MKPNPMPNHLQQLTEHINDWRTTDVRIDESKRLVNNVALTGTKSKNGYTYSEQALRDAALLYENKPVFLDHATNSARPHERSTRDLVGSIVNPRFTEGRIRADIRLLDTDSGRTFLALAESEAPAVGMSHVVLAERSSDKSRVEKIHDVVSVDAVVFPATTSTFREQHAPSSPPSPVAGSFESILSQIDKQLPAHIDRLGADPALPPRRVGIFPNQLLVECHSTGQSNPTLHSLSWHFDADEITLGNELTPHTETELLDNTWSQFLMDYTDKTNTEQTEHLQSQLKATQAERDQLKNALDQYQHEQQVRSLETEIEHLVEKSHLPNYCLTDLFRRQLREAPNNSTRRQLIAERQTLIRHSTQPPPNSQERPSTTTNTLSDQSIITTIKSH